MASSWTAWWSDWGASAWAEDVEAAVGQAEDWTDQVASARAWSGALKTAALDIVREAAEDAGDAGEYWAALVAAWPYDGGGVPGWDELGDTFRQAGVTAGTVDASRNEGTVDDVLAGAAAGSLETAAAGADWWGEYGGYVIAGVAVFGIGVFAWSAARR